MNDPRVTLAMVQAARAEADNLGKRLTEMEARWIIEAALRAQPFPESEGHDG